MNSLFKQKLNNKTAAEGFNDAIIEQIQVKIQRVKVISLDFNLSLTQSEPNISLRNNHLLLFCLKILIYYLSSIIIYSSPINKKRVHSRERKQSNE
jgi:hypothetical protein